MSLKENISMVKEELNTEEQFFEQAVKAERFVKRYKLPLIVAGISLVAAIAATAGYDAYKASGRAAANAAYTTLQATPGDAEAQAVLKADAPLLYDAWRLSVAVKAGDAQALKALGASAAPEVADISTYEAAALEKDPQALGAYAMRDDAIYKAMALIDEAVLLMHAGKTAEAHDRLRLIADDSPVGPLARALAHYGVK